MNIKFIFQGTKYSTLITSQRIYLINIYPLNHTQTLCSCLQPNEKFIPNFYESN